MSNGRPVRAILLVVCAVGLALAAYFLVPRDTYDELKNLRGPQKTKALPVEPEDQSQMWQQFREGGANRLAVLLTDPKSAWWGVQQALESIGIPHVITTDAAEAAKHRVVLVYPMISGKYVGREQQETLRQHVRGGGCLLATQVLGEDLKDLFGYASVQEQRTHYEVTFSKEEELTRGLVDERERTIRIGNPALPQTLIGTQTYTEPAQVLASYQDGKPAWIGKQHPGGGVAMALGFDLGFYILKCQNGRADEASRSYVNGYEPSVDVWLRLLRKMYQRYEPQAVTIDTVPDGKRIAAVMSFDVDYVKSMAQLAPYRDLLERNQVPATFFVQAKYYRDYFDSGFFNDKSVGMLRELSKAGMEIASHSVAHTDVFAELPMGTGTEMYPDYQPRVHERGDTRGATILGELRVSRFLLEKLMGKEVRSFRPGFLACPPALPQALEVAGYRYASSVTAGNVMTYLPYRKLFNRQYAARTSIYEFPVAVEDEHLPLMGERVDAAMELAEKLAAYGGTFVVLTHPNVVAHKYRFFEVILPKLKPMAWMGTLEQLGNWWDARGQMAIDVTAKASGAELRLRAPVSIRGVTLQVPAKWAKPEKLPEGARLENGRLYLAELRGEVVIGFTAE